MQPGSCMCFSTPADRITWVPSGLFQLANAAAVLSSAAAVMQHALQLPANLASILALPAMGSQSLSAAEGVLEDLPKSHGLGSQGFKHAKSLGNG